MRSWSLRKYLHLTFFWRSSYVFLSMSWANHLFIHFQENIPYHSTSLEFKADIFISLQKSEHSNESPVISVCLKMVMDMSSFLSISHNRLVRYQCFSPFCYMLSKLFLVSFYCNGQILQSNTNAFAKAKNYF